MQFPERKPYNMLSIAVSLSSDDTNTLALQYKITHLMMDHVIQEQLFVKKRKNIVLRCVNYIMYTNHK